MRAKSLISLEPREIARYIESLSNFNYQKLYELNHIPVLTDFYNMTGIDGLEMSWKYNKVWKGRKCDLNLPGAGYPYIEIIGSDVVVRVHFGAGGEISVTKEYYDSSRICQEE